MYGELPPFEKVGDPDCNDFLLKGEDAVWIDIEEIPEISLWISPLTRTIEVCNKENVEEVFQIIRL